jgi:hypothetical protein
VSLERADKLKVFMWRLLTYPKQFGETVVPTDVSLLHFLQTVT